jgi:hypothetical protein
MQRRRLKLAEYHLFTQEQLIPGLTDAVQMKVIKTG